MPAIHVIRLQQVVTLILLALSCVLAWFNEANCHVDHGQNNNDEGLWPGAHLKVRSWDT